MVPARINESALLVLVLLRDRSTGFDADFQLEPDEIRDELQMDNNTFKKEVSRLEGYGLVGTARSDETTLAGRSFTLQGVWITVDGDAYVEELERAPSIAKRITFSTLSAMAKAGRDVVVETAVQVLTRFIQSSDHG